MIELILRFLAETGYVGVFLLMVLENIFPPLPSELIMPFAGFVASRGELNLYGVIAAGTLGSVVGTLPWYLAGRWLGSARLKTLAERHGRWMGISADEIDKTSKWFNRWGHLAVLFGRLIPAVRTLISVPAGLAKLQFVPFLAYSTAGTLLWTSFLAVAGHWLGDNYEAVARFLDPVTKMILAASVAAYLFRVICKTKRNLP